MKLILSVLLFTLVYNTYAQQSRTDQVIPVHITETLSFQKSIEVKFNANLTKGAAPLAVQFTDQSTGSPTAWKWFFGDGDSAAIRNPSHIYKTPGIYSVRLIITEQNTKTPLEKKDYIWVIKSSQYYLDCDTLHYPLPEPLTYYIIPGKGYITGNNAYGDKSICDYYDNMKSNLVVSGLICEFSKAIQAPGKNEKIFFNIWKADGTTGLPGIVLATDSLPLSGIVNDVINKSFTTLNFDKPVQPGGSFYIGFTLPVVTGDTLCIWSTRSIKVPVNTTWILQSNNEWVSAQKLWPPLAGDLTFMISTAIYPKTCLINGMEDKEKYLAFSLFPNPAFEKITIVQHQKTDEKLQFHILDIFGKELCYGPVLKSASTTVDVDKLKPGIYLVRITGQKSSFSSTLIIR